MNDYTLRNSSLFEESIQDYSPSYDELDFFYELDRNFMTDSEDINAEQMSLPKSQKQDIFQYELEQERMIEKRCVHPDRINILHCFPVHGTTLQAFHHDQIERIIIKIAESFIDKKPINKIKIIGHSSTWKGISKKEYARRAQERAQNVANVIKSKLSELGLLKKVVISVENRADNEPLPGVNNKNQRNRDLNRRVEIKLVRGTITPSDDPAKKLKKFTKKDAEALALIIIGKRSRNVEVLQDLWMAFKEARGGIVSLLTAYFVGLRKEFNSSGVNTKKVYMGATYALMDKAHGKKRRLKSGSKGFRFGYAETRNLLERLDFDPVIGGQLEEIFNRIKDTLSKSIIATTIYRTLLRASYPFPTMKVNSWIGTAGWCVLSYPVISSKRCGPLPK